MITWVSDYKVGSDEKMGLMARLDLMEMWGV